MNIGFVSVACFWVIVLIFVVVRALSNIVVCSPSLIIVFRVSEVIRDVRVIVVIILVGQLEMLVL